MVPQLISQLGEAELASSLPLAMFFHSLLNLEGSSGTFVCSGHHFEDRGRTVSRDCKALSGACSTLSQPA